MPASRQTRDGRVSEAARGREALKGHEGTRPVKLRGSVAGRGAETEETVREFAEETRTGAIRSEVDTVSLRRRDGERE